MQSVSLSIATLRIWFVRYLRGKKNLKTATFVAPRVLRLIEFVVRERANRGRQKSTLKFGRPRDWTQDRWSRIAL